MLYFLIYKFVLFCAMWQEFDKPTEVNLHLQSCHGYLTVLFYGSENCSRVQKFLIYHVDEIISLQRRRIEINQISYFIFSKTDFVILNHFFLLVANVT